MGRGSWREFEAACRKPRETQEAVLREIVGANARTIFGSHHGFSTTWSSREFQESVPVRDYEAVRHYLDRVWNGEPRVITNEPVVMFSMTSGTTGKPKMLPVTQSAIESSRKLAAAWYYRSLEDHPGYLDGPILAVVGAEEEGLSPTGIPFGSASGRFYRRGPWVVRRAYAIPYVVFTVKDYEAKYYAIARFGIEASISFIGTPNPSTLVRIAEVIDKNRDELLKDVRDGTLSEKFAIPAAIRWELRERLRPNPGRARALEAAIGRNDVLRPGDYWPALRLMGCWKGGSVGVQLANARHWFGDSTPVRDLGYIASEAHMSLPVSDDGAAGALAVTANFYEFVREDEIESPSPTTLLADQLEEGQSYYVVVTTRTGLFRYDINDVVRVTGFFHRTPLIEFLRKGRDMTNIGGEKIHVSQIMTAFEEAVSNESIACTHYRAVADSAQNCYVFLVELSAPDEEQGRLEALLQAVDESLALSNVEYQSKRESGRLAPPCLHVMRSGWFFRSFQRRMEAGARDAQLKTALLSDRYEAGERDEIVKTVSWPVN